MNKTLPFIFALLFTIVSHSQNKVESALDEVFNGTTWERTTGTDYVYDGNNNLISATEYDRNTSAWQLSFKSTYTYNAANKVTEELGKYWDGSQYINNYRVINTYNGSGHLTQILEQDWNMTVWENVTKTDLTYSGNLPSSGITSTWDGMQWENETRTSVVYASNLPISSLSEYWDGSDWGTGTRTTWTYNGNDKRTSSLYESWDGTAWTEGYLTDYLLDANGNRIRETYTYLGEIQSKIEYNYDFTALLTNFAHPFRDKTGIDYLFEDFPYVNKILSGYNYTYDSNTSTYDATTRKTLNYNTSVLNTGSFAMQSIKLYPNPSTDFIQLTGLSAPEKVTIYSILGTKALETIVNADEQINVGNLAVGLYVVKLESGKTLNFLKK